MSLTGLLMGRLPRHDHSKCAALVKSPTVNPLDTCFFFFCCCCPPRARVLQTPLPPPHCRRRHAALLRRSSSREGETAVITGRHCRASHCASGVSGRVTNNAERLQSNPIIKLKKPNKTNKGKAFTLAMDTTTGAQPGDERMLVVQFICCKVIVYFLLTDINICTTSLKFGHILLI